MDAGSYKVIVPKIQNLLKRHRTNSIGARVTLSSQVTDVTTIYRHLTTSWVSIRRILARHGESGPAVPHRGQKMDNILDGFEELAMEYRDSRGRGTPAWFHQRKRHLERVALGCQQGLSLRRWRRFTRGWNGRRRQSLSSFRRCACRQDGSRKKRRRGPRSRAKHLPCDAPLGARYDCHTCWARPVCAGGCFHEAFIHYGKTSAANLHYCDWIRGWNDLCLQIYGEISVANPSFLNRFNDN